MDLDGTLAHYDGWKGPGHIGPPVPRMLERIKRHLAAGDDVRIFTARASARTVAEYTVFQEAMDAWCVEHLGVTLRVTAEKDFQMICLYDDRAIQIIPNTGLRADGAFEVSFPMAHEEIIPTWIELNQEILRLQDAAQQLSILRGQVRNQCRHPETKFRNGGADRDYRLCTTCLAHLPVED